MSRLEFILEIAATRDSMSDRLNVADALEDVARQLRTINATQRITGPVRDGNGSTVGTFALFVEEK